LPLLSFSTSSDSMSNSSAPRRITSSCSLTGIIYPFSRCKMQTIAVGVFSVKLHPPGKLRQIMRESISAILAQKLLTSLGRPGPRRIIAFLVLPFLGVVAAFGIAPDTTTDTIARKEVVEPLTLPATTLAAQPDAGFWREERVRRDDTIGTLLSRLGV